MTKNYEGIVPDLDQEFKNFSNLHDDNWDKIIDTGIPLFKKLKEAADPRSEGIKGTLEYTSNVIKNSGSVSPEEKKAIQDRIQEGLN